MSDSNLSHVQRLNLQKPEFTIMLLRGKDDFGRPFYAYLKVRPEKLQFLNEDRIKGKSINLPDYGEVLKKAWGEDPDPFTAALMAREYGYEDKPDTQE